MWAADGGHLEVVQYLVGERRVDPKLKNPDENTALFDAAGQNRLEVFQYLVENGADLGTRNKWGATAIDRAREKGYDEIVKFALRRTSSENSIFEAVENGDLERVKLLAIAYDVNAFNDSGKAVIHFAALGGRTDIVRFLVDEKHVDPNARDVSSHTPLMEAAFNGHMDVVGFLVGERGADVNARDVNQETALHKAAWNGQIEVVRYLGGRGADIGAADKRGETALQKAESNGKWDVVEYLRHFRRRRNVEELPVISSASRKTPFIAEALAFGSALVSTNLNRLRGAVSGFLGNNFQKPPGQVIVGDSLPSNTAAGFLLVQSFLDKKFPLPRWEPEGDNEALAETLSLVEELERQGNDDLYEVYGRVMGFLKNDESKKAYECLHGDQ